MSGEKKKRGLPDELERLAKASEAGDLGIVLSEDGLSREEAETVRLLNKVMENYRAATEYDLMKYRLTSDALGIGLWDMDVVSGDPINPDNKFTWTREFRRMLGFSDERDFPDLFRSWSDRLHPQDKERTLNALAAHLSDRTGRTPYDIEYRLRLKNGHYRIFHAFGATLRDGEGLPLRVAGALQDINEKKQMEEALTRRENMLDALNEMSIMLLTHKDESFDNVMSNGLRPVAEMMDIDRIAVFRLLEKHGRVGQVYLWSGKTIPLDEELLLLPDCPPINRWLEVLAKGECINADASKLPRDEGDFLGQFGVKSIFFVPIFTRGKFWGFITLEDHTNHRYFDEDSLDLLRSAAHICAGSVVRAEMEKAAAEAKELARAVAEASPFAYILFNRELRVVDCNDAAIRVLACPDKQHLIDHYWDVYSPEFQPDGQNSFEKGSILTDKAFKEGRAVYQWLHKSFDGTPIPMENTLTSLLYKDERFIISFKYDLSNTKKLTDSIRKQSELLKIRLQQQELTSDISRNFVAVGGSGALLSEALAKLGRHLGVSRILIFSLDYQSRKAGLEHSWYGSGSPRHGLEYVSWGDDSPPQRPAVSDLFDWITAHFPEKLPEDLAALTASCGDIIENTRENYQMLASVDIAAFISAPLYVEGRLWGSLSAEECRSPRAWTENEISFVSMVANVIAGAVMRGLYDKQRAELLERATAASKAKGDFLSNMSHEMRTPMNAIIGMAAMGKNAKDIEQKNYALNKIEDASSHLLGIINDVLDMAKIEANKLELAPFEYSLEKMLQKAVTVANFRVEEKGQRLSVKIDDRVPRFIVGDEQRLAQVITNLLSNAVKFTPEGGEISLEASLAGEDGENCELRIKVADSGIGISPEHRDKLFLAFEQAESGTSRKYGGTGLGLVISKRIVELMGGRIWIESELGKGARFIFTVNVRRVEKNTRSLLDPAVHWENVRILAVDDMLETRNQFLDIFSRLDITCDVASDGLEACRMIEERGKYDIYFIDWRMPGMDGIELTRRIKSQSDSSVAIMITAADWGQIKNEALEAGVTKYLMKPLFSSMIIDCVNECLRVPRDQDKDLESEDGLFEGHRLLLAEDMELNREILLTLLENTGILIDCAENGQEALDMIKAAPEKYDIVFMDIRMPQMDGLEATRRIRALPETKRGRLPIIAMTANVFSEDIDTCLEAGMDDHVGKPIDINLVLDKLRKYLIA